MRPKFFIFFLALLPVTVNGRSGDFDFVVSQDGSGDFRTIQEAVNAAPDFIKQDEVRIHILPGVYREKVTIPASKEKLHLIGDDAATTIISWDDFADRPGSTGYPMGTGGTASVFIFADDFLAENITFENTAGEVGQACAVTVDADRAAFIGCRFLGNQDTLYTYGDDERQYYRDCWIEGTTDFIFGYSTCWFENCTIVSKRNSYLTAASTLKERQWGYVFSNCRLLHTEGVDRCYLGRPWRKYARTVFLNCEMGDHILPEGWHNWGKKYAERTAFYAEYGSTGPGAAPRRARVKWAKTLSASKASAYSPSAVLACPPKEDKTGAFVPQEWFFKVF